MSLGQTISRLRAEHKLTQDDLAGRLEVSRQSVSKWETDASVPDLDKLVRLSELFGVTLDELVRGTAAEQPAPTAEPEPNANGRKRDIPLSRAVAGGVLLAVGLLGELLLLLFAGLEGVLLGLLLTTPFIACGLICLNARRRAGLWCAWAVYVLQQLYWSYATGITWALTLRTLNFVPSMNYARLAMAWVMLLVMAALAAGTVWSFRRVCLAPERRTTVLLAALWGLAILLFVPFAFPSGGNEIFILISLRQILRLAAVTGAATATAAALRGRRTVKEQV